MTTAKAFIVGLSLLVLSVSAQAQTCRNGTCCTTTPEGPYGGTAVQLPGSIEAEEYDLGGEGVGYSDTTPGNNPGDFRNDDVDILNRVDGFAVVSIRSGEYLRYTVDLPKQVDAFNFTFLVSAPAGFNGSFRVVSGGTGCEDYTTDISGLVPVLPTGEWKTYKELSIKGIGGLPAGSSLIRLCVVSRGFNIDSFTMVEQTSEKTSEDTSEALTLPGFPYQDTIPTVPGLVEAEEFDHGGKAVGNYDTTSGNRGNVLRLDTDVDIHQESFGYVVGWIADGEYLRYTIDVSRDVDLFYFVFKVASSNTHADAFHVVTGGTGCDDYTTDLSGLVTVPGGSGYMEVGIHGIGGLPQGSTYIWLCIINSGYNLDYFTMEEDNIEGGPHHGVAATVPGVIEAEAFDEGVKGMAYYDTTTGNTGNVLRLGTDVDIHQESFGYVVGWIADGEYLRYTIDVSRDVDLFYFVFKVASSNTHADAFHVVTGGTDCDNYATDLSGLVTVPGGSGYMEVGIQGIGGLPQGSAVIYLCIVNSGYNIDYFTMEEYDIAGGPHHGVAATVPGVIEAEEFDEGIKGVAYYDTTTGNTGNVLRLGTDVDIHQESFGYIVGWIADGEYLRYTIDVSRDVDLFYFVFRVASSNTITDAFHVVTGGTGCTDFRTDLSGLVTLPGGSGYRDVGIHGIGGLPQGSAVIYLCIINSGYNLDSLTMVEDEIASGPYHGVAAAVPGVIEAEEFDNGVEGVAYYDTTTGNSGNVLRLGTDVDIAQESFGYVVGWIASGEYLRYTIDVSRDVDLFYFVFKVESGNTIADAFHVVTGGTGCADYTTDLSGFVTLPGGSGYKDVGIHGIGGLPQGSAEIYLCIINSGYNLDYFFMLRDESTVRPE